MHDALTILYSYFSQSLMMNILLTSLGTGLSKVLLKPYRSDAIRLQIALYIRSNVYACIKLYNYMFLFRRCYVIMSGRNDERQ